MGRQYKRQMVAAAVPQNLYDRVGRLGRRWQEDLSVVGRVLFRLALAQDVDGRMKRKVGCHVGYPSVTLTKTEAAGLSPRFYFYANEGMVKRLEEIAEMCSTWNRSTVIRAMLEEGLDKAEELGL